MCCTEEHTRIGTHVKRATILGTLCITSQVDMQLISFSNFFYFWSCLSWLDFDFFIFLSSVTGPSHIWPWCTLQLHLNLPISISTVNWNKQLKLKLACCISFVNICCEDYSEKCSPKNSHSENQDKMLLARTEEQEKLPQISNHVDALNISLLSFSPVLKSIFCFALSLLIIVQTVRLIVFSLMFSDLTNNLVID